MQCFRRVTSIIRCNPHSTVLSIPPKRIYNLPIAIYRYNYEFSTINIEESEQDELKYEEMSNAFLGTALGGHRVFIIQPYIKWGVNKKRNTTPQLQLAEAEALIQTLPQWVVVDKTCLPLLSLQKNKLMGYGSLEELKKRIKSGDNISAIFISINMLKLVQVKELQKQFDLPVFDRYSIIIHIFRLHAKSPEAKLQVALAEIPYVWKKVLEGNADGKINLRETRKRILQDRQGKLQKALKKLQEHRHLLKRKRQICDIPSVAVVGYTNSGKTSLIKTLTGDSSMLPRNQLFATLDTTIHEGFLPCRIKVVYVDTIGFIQDIPEGLLAPFAVTLEDAIVADVIIHVYDVSHPDKQAQIDHMRDIFKSFLSNDRPVIQIANKCDLVERLTIPDDIIAVSAKNALGTDLLKIRIEEELLRSTNRKHIRMRVASGSEVAAWLYKELTVTNAEPDPKNSQYMYMDVIATENQIYQFKRFLRK